MGDRERRFRPEEVAGSEVGSDVPSTAELAATLGAARELEWLAAVDDVRPSADFADRVMSAVVTEPLPAPVAAAGAALGAGRLGALVAAFRDMWRVAFGGGRPYAVRAQALAIVLIVIVGAGSVTGLAAVGAWNVLSPERSPEVSPAVSPGPLPSPTESGPAEPTESPPPSESAEPTESAEPSGTPEPSETPEASSPAPTSPQATARPTATPTPRPTPEPTSSETPEPSKTPEPTDTPKPSETPKPTGTDDHGGG